MPTSPSSIQRGRRYHLREGHRRPAPADQGDQAPSGRHRAGHPDEHDQRDQGQDPVQVPADRLQPDQRTGGQGDLREGRPGPGTDQPGRWTRRTTRGLRLEDYKQLLDGIGKVKIMAPQIDCLSPIGENLIRKGLKNVLIEIKPEFYAPPVTREPKVIRGQPLPGGGRHRLWRGHAVGSAGADPAVREPGATALPAGRLLRHQGHRGAPTGGATAWSRRGG